jgi:hypothetical protein
VGTDGGMTETWEALCDEGREAAQDMDGGRWRLGDLSLEIQKEYGKNRIAEFAKEINVPVGRVREYRTVAGYWKNQHRQKLLDDCPTLSYSHFRLAMRYDDIEEAIEFLIECADDAWTVERATVEINKRSKKRVPPPKLLDAEGTLKHADLETGVIVFQVGEGANLTGLQSYIEREARLVIHALEPEKKDESEEPDG